MRKSRVKYIPWTYIFKQCCTYHQRDSMEVEVNKRELLGYLAIKGQKYRFTGSSTLLNV